MIGAGNLTIQQQIILARNPHLWPASILDDKAVLVLDRTALGSSKIYPISYVSGGVYVVLMNGAIQGVFHHYIKYHDFTFAEPQPQREPNPSPNPPKSSELEKMATQVDNLIAMAAEKRDRRE